MTGSLAGEASGSGRGGLSRAFLWLGVFAAAMGILEAVVVVYLRWLAHPDGFFFPLTPWSPQLVAVEWVREISTLVMLAARSRRQWGAWFLYAFGVWDLAYYAGLKALLDWPESWSTWDVLFLIPIPWLGPVWAPALCSLTMIGLAALILSGGVRFGRRASALVWGGAGVILATFLADYAGLIVGGGFLGRWTTLATDPQFRAVAGAYVPQRYAWEAFAVGWLLILAGAAVARREGSRLGSNPRLGKSGGMR